MVKKKVTIIIIIVLDYVIRFLSSMSLYWSFFLFTSVSVCILPSGW